MLPFVNNTSGNDALTYKKLRWEGVQMFVTRLVVGSGRANTRGASPKKGKLYAAENPDGDLESFYLVEMRALYISM